MKSRFFGLSAKLALAVLAVGFTFTSCYDSANESIVIPGKVELPAPSYEVSGYVTNFLTGAPIQGVSVQTPIGPATTDATGNYKVTGPSVVSGDNVSFSADGYQTVSVTLKVNKEVTTGLVSYSVNIALKPEGYVDGVQVNNLGQNQESAVESAATVVKDLVNTTDETVIIPLPLKVKDGARWATTRASQEEFVAYIKALYGVDVKDEFVDVEKTFYIPIAGQSEATSVSVTTIIATENYTFPEGDVFTIQRVLGHIVTPNLRPIPHKHDHDHGGNSNSGGGVGTSD